MKITPICLFVFHLIFHFSIFAQRNSVPGNISDKPITYDIHAVRLGERIFHGLIPAVSAVNCASCHNVNSIDTLNWNPSALEIALKYKNQNFEAFKSAIMEPTGQVMISLHESLSFTDDQLQQIRSYLLELAHKGEKPLKPSRTNLFIFILLILIFILAFADLAITKIIKFRIVHFALLTISLLFITRIVVKSAIDLGRSENYQPDQPIKFSHLIHAGQNQTDCLYCHFNAETSRYAGIPPANVCTNCHVLVKEGSRSGKFEIAKIYHALENNRSIQWVKVHNVPDHVIFNHAQHVVAGKIDCIVCHGNVAAMDQIVQVKDLSMGWCVDCHRETSVRFDNRFYGEYEQLHSDLREGRITEVTVEQIGGIDCMKCHY